MALTKKDHCFLRKLIKLARKSTCLRAKMGAILVKSGKILEEATNDFHPIYDCTKIGCIRAIRKIPHGKEREVCYGLCAEQWLFTKIARTPKKMKGATLYVTAHPCRVCESMLAEAGIKRIVFIKGYPDTFPKYDILKDYGVIVEQAGEEYRDLLPHRV